MMFDSEVQHTSRNFRFYEFKDSYGFDCTIQKSSLATSDCIWLGLQSASAKVLHGDATRLGIDHDKTCGWVDYPIPEEVSLNTRMHLTREQAGDLSRMLAYFSSVGELPRMAPGQPFTTLEKPDND